jgi:hypothetical protein
MKKTEKHFERIILITAAVVAIGLSGWLILESSAFAQSLSLPAARPKSDFGIIPIEQVDTALTTLTANFKPWISPVRNNKPVPLNRSVLLVLKEDQIYDLFLEDKKLREPMSNEYLRRHNLEYLSPNVGDLDPDHDGFNNLEEFQKGTDPKDGKSHPEVTDRLFLVERISHDYLVELKSTGEPPFQVSVIPQDGKKKGWFVELGKPFGVDNRFVPIKFEKKTVPDPKIGEKDVSELTVEDTLRKTKLVLIKDVKQNLAEYDAKFEFRLGKLKTFVVPKEGTFRLEGFGDTTYKVIDIQDENAVISPLNSAGDPIKSKEIIIKKG